MDGGTDDCEVVRSILNGHPEDFRMVVAKYKKLVAHIVYRMVSDPGEKDDLGQEIFIRIYQALPAFEFRSSLATWISKIAYNCCLNHLRKTKMLRRNVTVYDDREGHATPGGGQDIMETVSANGGAPDDAVITKEIHRFLRDAIAALPVTLRTIVTFFYLDDMSLMDIAKIMDLPIGSVKGYLFRARKLLKDQLLSHYDREDVCPWSI